MDKLLLALSGGPLNGLKMLVGYVLANVAVGHPLLVQAIQTLMESPSFPNFLAVLAQIILIWGGVHDIVKKVK